MRPGWATIVTLVCSACEPELFTSTVTRLNHAPEPESDSYIGAADATLSIAAVDGVLANDSDPDGDPLTVRVGVPPTVGTVELAADGGFVYTPGGGFAGVDSFTYLASDGTEEVSATVNLQIRRVDEPPLAWATAAPLTGRVPLTVVFDGSGSSDDHNITEFAWTFGDGATATGATSGHTYFDAGTWVAELTVTDDGGATDTDTVAIQVTPAIPTMSAWAARDQNPAEVWIDSTWAAGTIRTTVRGVPQTLTGSTVAVLLRPRSSGDYVIQHMSLARRDGTTLDVDDTTSARVTFGGSWDDPVTVSANCPLLSDPVDFNLEGSDVFATFWANGPTDYLTGSAGTNTWVINADESATLDWEGLTTDESNGNVYSVDTVAVVGTLGEPAPILIAHWPLDESTGPRADSTGRGNTLSATGTVAAGAGVHGDAASFDGASFLGIADATQTGLDVASGLAVAAHFNATTVAGAHTVVAKHDNNGNQRSYRIRIDAGVLFATLSTDGTAELNLTGTTTLATGIWYHVALVFDACANTVTLYLDGNVDASATAGFGVLHDSSTDFTVGARMAVAAAEEFFEGFIDDVRLYTTPLTESEVQELAD